MDCRLLAVLPLALVSATTAPPDNPGNGSPDEPVWAHPLLASGAQFVNAVHTSAEGDIYVTGYAAGRLDAHGDTLEGEGGGDPFLLKYDAEGRLAWARQGRGPGWSGGRSLATDERGDAISNVWKAAFSRADQPMPNFWINGWFEDGASGKYVEYRKLSDVAAGVSRWSWDESAGYVYVRTSDDRPPGGFRVGEPCATPATSLDARRPAWFLV